MRNLTGRQDPWNRKILRNVKDDKVHKKDTICNAMLLTLLVTLMRLQELINFLPSLKDLILGELLELT